MIPYQNGGKYIRPIALFQAQPKGKEDATTFEKLRAELMNTGIPAEHIAIRTADVNELKNVDLLSPDCPVRYIITVNALKEGWDCPFAYILASLANKTSQVDVEQILGRILRLPYTVEHRAKALNMSYVLTSSNDFNDAVQQIIRGLNSAGFSDRDCRLAEPVEPAKPAPVPEQLPIIEPEAPQEDFAGLDGKSIGAELQRRRESENSPESAPKADSMLAEAQQAGDAYNQAVQGADNDPFAAALPWEVRDKVNTFHIIPQYQESVDGLLIPQFFQPTSSTAIYGKSLYEAEEDMNALEQDLVKRLTAIPNVLWWHRNIARHGFAINGYFNHYPDIMIMTKSGKIILAETKGEHLKNDDSREKIELGAAWRNAAGNRYRYYMVFRDEENLPHGAVSMGQFVETVEAL